MRKLYMAPISPFARKVRILLHEKGLEFEQDVQRGSRGSREFAAINPALTIPVLVDEEITLFDSNVIAEYLLDTYPENLSQESPPLTSTLLRANFKWRDRKVLCIAQTLMDTAVSLHMLRGVGVAPEEISYLQRHQTRLKSCLDWLEQEASPEGFVPGCLSVMDVSLICTLDLIDLSNKHRFTNEAPMVTWRGRPNIEALISFFSTRSSVRESSPEGYVPISKNQAVAQMKS